MEKKKQDGDPPMNQLCACRSVGGALLLSALCGLFSTPPAHAEDGARHATPPSGKALVSVFRIDRAPLAAQVPVIVNTALVGELAHDTFITATVSPGNTYLRIGDRLLSTLSFVAAADQSYFVRVEAIYGQTLVRTEVYLVSETEGRRALAQSRFVGVAPAVVAPAPPTEQPSYAAEPAATQPAAAREIPVPTESGRDWDIALIANAGTFKLANGNQVIGALPSTYDTTSKSVFGFGAEWRRGAGVAAGGEVFSYKNALVSTGAIPNAQQEVLAIMVNGKYYFRAASWLYPFVGAGIGLARATYSGGFKGNATGLAYQGLAGLEFRFKPVGLYVQYKYLAATTGRTSNEVKVGGSGILAGVSIIF